MRAAVTCVGVLATLLLAACETEPNSELSAPIEGTEVGRTAPEIQGVLPSGEAHSVEVARGAPTVLVFYRSIECGLCRLQLEEMQRNLGAYERSGADLVALTLDPPELSRAWREESAPGFPIVSVDSATFQRWGALAPEHSAPLPATFVLDGSGVVRFAYIGRNASDRTSDAEVVSVLEGIGGG